jgi:hypothetical protein
MMLPIVESPLALMVPTWAMSFLPDVGLDIPLSAPTMTSTALSMPRFRSMGLWPAATRRRPSW